jgi:hypothetical protein
MIIRELYLLINFMQKAYIHNLNFYDFYFYKQIGSLSEAAGYRLDDQGGFPFGGRCCFITMSWTASCPPSYPVGTGVCCPKCKV